MVSQKKKILCLLLSCDLLVARLNATALTVDIARDLEIGSHKHDKQVLCKDSPGPQILKPGTLIYLGKKVTSGGYGIIYEGSFSNRKVIIKRIRPEKGTKGQVGIQTEWDNSRALLDRIAEKMEQDSIQYGQLFATDPIIPAIAQTMDGSLVQKKVLGQDLRKIVFSKQAPYCSCYPDRLRDALICAADFFRGLAILHHLGFVHCDIKPGNVMIDDERCLCHIIDLGGMKKFGEKIRIHSNNGAPEFIEQTCAIKNYKAKRKELLDEQTQIASKIEAANEPIEGLQERNKAIEAELLEIATAIRLAQKKRDTVARPTYDIYSSVPILLAILFGKIGYQLANYLYFPQEKDSVLFHYLNTARQPGFNGEEYFMGRCFELNQVMQKKSGQTYPETVIKQLVQLLARMSSLDPNERPSAIDILEALEHMATLL
ncbi:MAG: serine/threonine-protein kinase [Puniceicoccales bacterium]|jgi:serine/threonine protein kinase|nr:serine/threonine-protein kinase [Puniceicoccales bacterium]